MKTQDIYIVMKANVVEPVAGYYLLYKAQEKAEELENKLQMPKNFLVLQTRKWK